MALAGTIVDMWSDTKRLHVVATIAASGNYATGGMAFNPLSAITDSRPGFASTPIAPNKVVVASFIKGIAGFEYEFDKVNNKILIRSSAAATPAGTNSTSAVTGTAAGQVFTGAALAGHTHTFAGDALATHTHDMRIMGGQGAAGTDAVTAPDATDILGKQEAGDAAILGADSATKGGVVAAGAGTPAGTNSSDSAGTPAGTNAASALTATAAAQTFTGTAIAAAALAQLAAAALPAGVTGDTITAYFIFK